MQKEQEHFLIGLSYNEYKPGMKLYLHQDHETLKQGDIVEIEEVNGYDKATNTYKFPWGKGHLYFITKNGVKITWNEVKISCYIERDQTTSFLEKMIDHYRDVADRNLNDKENYGWEQRHYENFLEEKHGTLLEILLQYEYQRLDKTQTNRKE